MARDNFPAPPPLSAHSPHPARHLIRPKTTKIEPDFDDDDGLADSSSISSSAGKKRKATHKKKAPRELAFDPLALDTPSVGGKFPLIHQQASAIELGARISESFGASDVRMFGPVRATRGMFMSKHFKRYAQLKSKDKKFEPNNAKGRITLILAGIVMFLLFAMNCLDLALPRYADLTILNIAGISMVAVEISLIPFFIPFLWKKMNCLHSSFEIKVSRHVHPKWKTVGLPVLGGFVLGAALVLYYLSLNGASLQASYNVFLIFTCPQPLIVLGLSVFWKRERPYMTAIINAFALSGAYIFLLWDYSSPLMLPAAAVGFAACAFVANLLGAGFYFILRRSIQMSGIRWTVFIIALIASTICFALGIFFVGVSPWSALEAAYSATGAVAAYPILLRALVGAGWIWAVVGVFCYADLLIASYLVVAAVVSNSSRVFGLVRSAADWTAWTLMVGAAMSGIVFIIMVIQILSLERRITERDANERSKFREKIAAAKERAAIDIISPRSEVDQAVMEATRDGPEVPPTPTWSYWNASNVKGAAHYHPSTPHLGGRYSLAANEMGRRSAYGSPSPPDAVTAHNVTVSTEPPPTVTFMEPSGAPRITVIGQQQPLTYQ